MKKVLVILLCLVLAFSFTSCGLQKAIDRVHEIEEDNEENDPSDQEDKGKKDTIGSISDKDAQDYLNNDNSDEVISITDSNPDSPDTRPSPDDFTNFKAALGNIIMAYMGAKEPYNKILEATPDKDDYLFDTLSYYTLDLSVAMVPLYDALSLAGTNETKVSGTLPLLGYEGFKEKDGNLIRFGNENIFEEDSGVNAKGDSYHQIREGSESDETETATEEDSTVADKDKDEDRDKDEDKDKYEDEDENNDKDKDPDKDASKDANYAIYCNDTVNVEKDGLIMTFTLVLFATSADGQNYTADMSLDYGLDAAQLTGLGGAPIEGLGGFNVSQHAESVSFQVNHMDLDNYAKYGTNATEDEFVPVPLIKGDGMALLTANMSGTGNLGITITGDIDIQGGSATAESGDSSTSAAGPVVMKMSIKDGFVEIEIPSLKKAMGYESFDAILTTSSDIIDQANDISEKAFEKSSENEE